MSNNTQKAPLEGVPSKGIHHIAFGTKQSRATYEFYHEKLGMPLVRTENHRQGKGYFRHFFFDMGQEQYLGFFELNGCGEKEDCKTDLSISLGMPMWVNHVAFNAVNKERFQQIVQRMKDKHVPIMAKVDHDWCESVYTVDPNGIMMEFSYDKNPSEFTQTEQEAYDLLFNTSDDMIEDDSRKTKIDRDV